MAQSISKWHRARARQAQITLLAVGYGLAMLMSGGVWIALAIWLVN